MVGHARGAVEAALESSPVTIAFNPDFEAGIAPSLKVGLAATPPGCDGAVVLLGDMPDVAPRLIDDLIAAFEARPTAQAVAPIRDGRRGNPVSSPGPFSRRRRVSSATKGARLLLALGPAAVTELAAASDVAFDVDTPEDLAAARRTKSEPPGRSG